ncbi:MAG: hypothetical protein KIT22_12235 [Verrucomicrobiae bacterium]|nr:hypothetical protein [Verrucomicrobiae bacterium]
MRSATKVRTDAIPGVLIPVLGLLASLAMSARAATLSIEVPNGSFERPATVFVSTDIEAWQKSPEPPNHEPDGFPWFQRAGIFKNTAPSRPDHIPNLDGDQALYLFAVPGVGVFQQGTSESGAFPVAYQAGDVFTLTVGLIGGGGNMPEGARMRLELGYVDTTGNRQPIARTEAVHSREQFPTTTHLIDFTVSTPPVKDSDPWSGRPLSLELVSVGSEFIGGYWDLDHVRLTVTRGGSEGFPISVAAIPMGMQISWTGTTGTNYRVEQSPDLRSWNAAGDWVPGVGEKIRVELQVAGSEPLFVRVVSDATL